MVVTPLASSNFCLLVYFCGTISIIFSSALSLFYGYIAPAQVDCRCPPPPLTSYFFPGCWCTLVHCNIQSYGWVHCTLINQAVLFIVKHILIVIVLATIVITVAYFLFTLPSSVGWWTPLTPWWSWQHPSGTLVWATLSSRADHSCV